MKIKKMDDKTMVIHTKEKSKLHVKSAHEAKIKGRNILTVTRAPKIAGVRDGTENTTTNKRKVVRKADLSERRIDNQKNINIKEAVLKEDSFRNQYLKAKKEREAAVGKKSGSIRTAGAVGSKTALNQIEGGNEIYESVQVMSSLSIPAANATEAGRRLYRSKAAKKQAEKHIKKMNGAKKIGKKAVKDTAVKSAKKAAKETAKKVAKETAKTTAKVTAQVAGTVAGTATTGVGGFLIGAAAGEAVGMMMDKQEVKNSARNRMIQLFIAKLRQEDNQDNIVKALKDIVRMQFAIVMKYIVTYTALFLFGAFVLVALVALPIIAVLAVIYNSPFSIFFPSPSEDTIQNVLSAYVAEFNRDVNTELSQDEGYDRSEKIYIDFEGDGAPDNYYDILAVYMVKYGNGDTATDMTEKAKENLKKVFDDMCGYNTSSGTVTETDEEGNEITYSVKYINITLKTCQDMILQYGFNSEEVDMLLEIMKPENLAMLGYTGNGDPGQTTIDNGQYRAIVDAISDENGRKVVEFALSKVGYPYSQAYRDSGRYYDCSSLAYYAWRNAGVSIMYEGSNTAASEGKYCYDKSYLVNYSEMQPGDLIFYSYARNGRFMNISHVAIYVGNGMVVEAANERLGVVYRPVQSRNAIVFIGRPR